MKITDFILPKDLNEDWIVIHTVWSGKTGTLQAERIDVHSAFKPINVICTKHYAKQYQLMEELQRQRGDLSACVSTGEQARCGTAYRFLPEV